MILRWSPFKIVSVSAVLYPRWPPLLKIEISSNGQNCSILSQKVPKFQLYKHSDELFNFYYRIFYELWNFDDFDRLCKLEKRGDEIKKKSSPLKLLSQSQANFAEMILRWSPFKIVSVSAVLYPRWPPLLKIEISSNGQNCSILPILFLYLNTVTVTTGTFEPQWEREVWRLKIWFNPPFL